MGVSGVKTVEGASRESQKTACSPQALLAILTLGFLFHQDSLYIYIVKPGEGAVLSISTGKYG